MPLAATGSSSPPTNLISLIPSLPLSTTALLIVHLPSHSPSLPPSHYQPPLPCDPPDHYPLVIRLTIIPHYGNCVVSPRMQRASCISFGMMVTHLLWMAMSCVSSNRPMRCASAASWFASKEESCILQSFFF